MSNPTYFVEADEEDAQELFAVLERLVDVWRNDPELFTGFAILLERTGTGPGMEA